MISQQLCPACSAANPGLASSCESCGANLGTPAADGGTEMTYEAAPRSGAGSSQESLAEGWPLERLTPSRTDEPADRWAGIPRGRIDLPAPPRPPDWLQPRPGVLPTSSSSPPPARPTPSPGPPLGFHLDVGAGAALAAGRATPPAPTPAPAPPSSSVAPSSPLPPPPFGGLSTLPRGPRAAPATEWSWDRPGGDGGAAAVPGGPDDGGHGWGVRPQRATRGPSWLAPHPAVGTPAPAQGATAAAPAQPPAPPWQPLAAQQATSHVGLGLVALLLVLLAFGGGLWYLTYGPGSASPGLGGGTHSVRTPAAIGGWAADPGSSHAATASAIRSEISSNPAVTSAAVGAYVSPSAGAWYVAVLASADRALTGSDLATDVAQVNQGAGWGFDLSRATVSRQGDVNFSCGPLNAAALPGASACWWIDGNVQGVLIGSSGMSSAALLAGAEEARTAGEQPS